MSEKTCLSPLATRPVLYTDTVGGKQTCRDDLWAVTTDELNGATTQPREQAYTISPVLVLETALSDADIRALARWEEEMRDWYARQAAPAPPGEQPREQADDPIAEIQRLVAANDELRAINERLRAEALTRQAAPEAPTASWFDSGMDTGIVPAAATTASASTEQCAHCNGSGWRIGSVPCPYCRATAPSRNAGPIKTWQERCPEVGSFEDLRIAMQAEINDLRAALTQQSAAQAPMPDDALMRRAATVVPRLYNEAPNLLADDYCSQIVAKIKGGA